MEKPFNFDKHPKFVAIVGSRKWTRRDWIDKFVNRLQPFTAVVSGGAKGVDSFAQYAAERRRAESGGKFFFKEFPVEDFEWDEDFLHKQAGHVRNLILVTYIKRVKGHVVIFALTNDEGNIEGGSKNVRDLCVQLDVPYTLYTLTKELQ